MYLHLFEEYIDTEPCMTSRLLTETPCTLPRPTCELRVITERGKLLDVKFISFNNYMSASE